MKSFFQLSLLFFFMLAACKKENMVYQQLQITGLSSIAFASGDAISVYGAGFDTIPANNVVTFNGVPGEVVAAAPNRLQVIAPLLVSAGKVKVQTHGATATSEQTFNIVNVLQGTYKDNLTLTADKKYLLRGPVVFNAKLIIEAGTVIYGEKLTQGSLTLSNADFEGTPDKPIVFTSDQAPGNRTPGDWGGVITTAIPPAIGVPFFPLGIIEYVRIEYAGYHLPGAQGQALKLIADPNSVLKYIQVSYSAGDGITFSTQSGTSNSYVEHVVALGCGGADFHITTQASSLTMQYGFGLKDPYYADPIKGDGLFSEGSLVASNFTLVGYNPAARGITAPAALPLTANAGAGIRLNNVFALYNSVIAGSWSAGLELWWGIYGNQGNTNSSWDNYEDSIPASSYQFDVTLRNNYFVGTASNMLPATGGVMGRYNYQGSDGFEDISSSTQLALFGMFNDTTRQISELGLNGITDYQQLHHPMVLPPAGSPLLTSALFGANTPANTPLLNKAITYAGAFGTSDWTQGWTNFNPQQTAY